MSRSTHQTLGDSPVKQPLGTGHGKQRADAHRPSRLAKDGDVAGITTEGGDILPYPLEGSNLVEQAAVGVSLAQREEPLGTNTIIDGHADDAVAGEVAAVIRRPRSGLKGTAGETSTELEEKRCLKRRKEDFCEAMRSENVIESREKTGTRKEREGWPYACVSRARPAGPAGP
jgi:hypothetical protein